MDAIFKALGDETRRRLLDMLRERDGQTLSELEGALGMTRFGVMKHLKVLEAASLVVTKRSGRFKHHYLNVLPLQEVIDRWVEPLTQKPMARAVLDFKAGLEGVDDMTTETAAKPDFVLETFIKASPEKVWDALTKGDLTKKYYIAHATLHGTMEAGQHYEYRGPDGAVMLSGEILEAKKPHRLEMTFIPGWIQGDVPPSRNVYELEAKGAVCKLTILHFGIAPGLEGVREGWARIASSLKSLLETGEALTIT